MLLEILAVVVVLLLLGYRWAMANFDFFEKRGIPHHKPHHFLGSTWKMLWGKQSFVDWIVEMYSKSDSKVYGFFENRTPLLMIRDPELVKQISIKDFDHFMNHRNIFGGDQEEDPHSMDNLFSSSLFSMRDARWKDMRSTLSPAFTGRKMRQMFQLMDLVAKEAVASLKKEPTVGDGLELDMKNYCTRFTNDVIASTAFGLQVNSFTEKENTFFMLGKKLTKFSKLQNFKFILFFVAKWLFKLLKLSLFDKQSTDYFVNLVLDAMKYRQEHNVVRPDMINMLMEARGLLQTDKSKTAQVRDWSDRDIVAQCFVFFFAGFETSAVLMCFAAHELMENEDIQKRLYEEVLQVDSALDGGPLSYEALMGMKYLDQVISETLRKWPPTVATDRECNKDITYEVDDITVNIKKGEGIWFPVCGFHRDPKYFENPLKFDPERFNEENKDKIQPFTYLPFGVGPRNCIGSRFVLLETKALLYYILRDFQIAAAKKSTIPLVLGPASFQLAPKNGFWLKFVPRN